MKTRHILSAILAAALLALCACGPSKPKGPEPDATTKQKVVEVIAEVLEISPTTVSLASPLQGDKLNADPQQVGQIVMEAGEACDVEIHNSDISSSGNIPMSFSGEDLARLIAKKKAGGGTP